MQNTSSYLKEGDAISLFFSSSRPPMEAVRFMIDFLEKKNLRPIFHEELLAPENAPYFKYYKTALYANTDEKRIAAFQQALNDDSPVLWALTGGYGAQMILNALEKGQIILPKKPKVIIGFSDITVLHQFFLSKGWPTLHGPVACYNKEAWDLHRFPVNALASAEETIDWLMHPTPLTYTLIPLNEPARNKGRVIDSTVVGGNLALLSEHGGTPTGLDGKGKGKIIFLEDTPERPERTERRFLSLIRAGVFDQADAVFLGDLPCDEEIMKEDVTSAQKKAIIDVVNQRLCDLLTINGIDIPVVYSPDFGHAAKNELLPLGAPAQLTLGDTVTLTLYEWCRK